MVDDILNKVSIHLSIKPELTICLLDSLCTNDIALLLINRQRVHKCLHSLIRAKISAYSVRVYKVTFSTDSYLSTLLLSAICFKLLETLAKLGDTLPEVLHVLHCTSIKRWMPGFKINWLYGVLLSFSKLSFYSFQNLERNSKLVVSTTVVTAEYKRLSCLSSWLHGTQWVTYTREEVVLVAGYAVRGTQWALRCRIAEYQNIKLTEILRFWDFDIIVITISKYQINCDILRFWDVHIIIIIFWNYQMILIYQNIKLTVRFQDFAM